MSCLVKIVLILIFVVDLMYWVTTTIHIFQTRAVVLTWSSPLLELKKGENDKQWSVATTTAIDSLCLSLYLQI